MIDWCMKLGIWMLIQMKLHFKFLCQNEISWRLVAFEDIYGKIIKVFKQ